MLASSRSSKSGSSGVFCPKRIRESPTAGPELARILWVNQSADHPRVHVNYAPAAADENKQLPDGTRAAEEFSGIISEGGREEPTRGKTVRRPARSSRGQAFARHRRHNFAEAIELRQSRVEIGRDTQTLKFFVNDRSREDTMLVEQIAPNLSLI